MELVDHTDEDQLIEYALRLSMQENFKFSDLQNPSVSPPSEENVLILKAIDEGDMLALMAHVNFSFAYNERDSKGWLPLHVAAAQPKWNVLDIVITGSRDMTVEAKTSDGETALTLATRAGHVKNVNVLLRRGASPHRTNDNDESPLLLAVRSGRYEMVQTLMIGGACVEQMCRQSWTATHEAAKVGNCDILMLLLRHGGKVNARDGHGVTPLGVAAEFGHPYILEYLIANGGDVFSKSTNGDTVLHEAAASGSLDCINLLLECGANPSIPNLRSQLPIHKAAYAGHYKALKLFILITNKKTLRLSGMSPVHSAADGGHPRCLRLLTENYFDVNSLLEPFISENYGDMRRSALYFAVTNGDIACSRVLLRAGARPDKDPLNCLLVAVRAGNYELVRLLLRYGADANCYFTELWNTVYPTALQYCLKDMKMIRLLLNNGYNAESCFQCYHHEGSLCVTPWREESRKPCMESDEAEEVVFCDVISVPSMGHYVGKLVLALLDYVHHVPLCHKLQTALENTEEWPDIYYTLTNPRSLQHQCRLLIRKHISNRRLNDPDYMNTVRFPPGIKKYLVYKEYDVCD